MRAPALFIRKSGCTDVFLPGSNEDIKQNLTRIGQSRTTQSRLRPCVDGFWGGCGDDIVKAST